MFNAGMVLPGSKVWIPVNTFDSNDPSASVTATTWANTDCHVHKDAGTTQRASSAGETLSLNFDSITGGHILELDLADNTTAGFYAAGSTYHVRIEGVTVDAGNVSAWIGSFSIGYPGAILNTSIASLTSATQFILTKGPAEADVLIGCPVLLHDVASEVQTAIGYISDYIVTTKEVFLAATPTGFTPVATDNISIFMPSNTQAVGTTLQTPNDNGADINTLITQVGTAGDGLTAINLPDQTMAITGNITGDLSGSVGSVTGAVGSVTGAVGSVTGAVGSVTGAVGSVTGHTNQTGDTFALANGATGFVAIDTVVDAIKVVTDAIGATGTGLSAIPWNAAWDAQVESEVNDALVALGLDHLVGASVTGTDVTDNSIIAKMVASGATADWDTFVNTTESLQALKDHIGDGTNLTEAGGTGDQLTAINLPNQTMDITGDITGNLSGSVGSVTGAVGSVTGAVGSVTGHTNQTGDTFALANGATGFAAIDTVVDAIKVITDALGAAAAAKLALTMGASPTGTVDTTVASTTTEFESASITTAAADHFIGRIVLFTTGAGILDEQATDITDYALNGGKAHFTVTALTSAPADTAPFIII